MAAGGQDAAGPSTLHPDNGSDDQGEHGADVDPPPSMASDDTGINEEEDEDEAFLLCETGNQLEAEKAKKEPMELVDDFGEVR